MSILIKNCRLMQTQPPFDVKEGMDVLIEDNLIKRIGVKLEVKADKVIDATGRTLIPGNVCAHHHYYSGLSRGMLISAGPQTDFIQVLKEWWWRLDRGLDEEACYYSSLICSMDAIASGTTCAIDHHASPSYINGSLSTIAKGMEEVGLRGATCYEVTDRNEGMKEVEEGVEENVRFAKEVDSKRKAGKKVLCEAMIGGHAPFTVPDEGLKLMAKACQETGRGIHFHIAEDKYDSIYSHHNYNKDIVRRLDDMGLLSDKSLLVHGLFINDDEVKLLNERGCFFAHNARSNMNNHVGYCKQIQNINKLVIGTDGCGGNMFEELKLAFFKHKDEGGSWWPSDYLTALNRGNRLVESVFQNENKWGQVAEGNVADLVLLNYHNPTPLCSANAAGHFVWGMSSNAVESVIVDGELLYENYRFTKIDADKVYREAAQIAEKLWKKVDKIKA